MNITHCPRCNSELKNYSDHYLICLNCPLTSSRFWCEWSRRNYWYSLYTKKYWIIHCLDLNDNYRYIIYDNNNAGIGSFPEIPISSTPLYLLSDNEIDTYIDSYLIFS
jgi:hypothetical protein